MPICLACKREHPRLMRCEVAKRLAINGTGNTGAAINGRLTQNAINNANSSTDAALLQEVVDAPTDEKNHEAHGLGKTSNRRSREAYNAYMRDYMRRNRKRNGGA